MSAATPYSPPLPPGAKVGTVRYADVMREGGPGSRSKGCGIVEFETPEEALAAIQHLNHTELDGRQIFVREARCLPRLPGSPARLPALLLPLLLHPPAASQLGRRLTQAPCLLQSIAGPRGL